MKDDGLNALRGAMNAIVISAFMWFGIFCVWLFVF